MPTEGSNRISNSKVGTYKINACKANGYLKYVMKMPYGKSFEKKYRLQAKCPKTRRLISLDGFDGSEGPVP